jgi:alanyl-tRNA synthetase
MQYGKQQDGSFKPLEQKNVDTGMGLERTICVLTGKKTVYETDAFAGILGKIAELSGKEYGADAETTKAFRIIGDHYAHRYLHPWANDRGVQPVQHGSGLYPPPPDPPRRPLRHAAGLPDGFTALLAQVIIDQYAGVYPELKRNSAFVLEQLQLEKRASPHAQAGQ